MDQRAGDAAPSIASYFFSSASTLPRELPTFLTAWRTSPEVVPVFFASYAVSCFWPPATLRAVLRTTSLGLFSHVCS